MSDKLINDLDVEQGEAAKKLTAEVMNNPEVLAAMQSQLAQVDKMMHLTYSLPPKVRRRIKALKKMQFDMLKIDAELAKKSYELEVEFAKKKDELYKKRQLIVTGDHEPNDAEADWPSDEEEEDADEETEKLRKDLKEKAQLEEQQNPAKGVPEFWLTIFKNTDLIAEMIQEHDEPILKHLVDVRVIHSLQPMKFTLEFHFAPNEFFTNQVLTKEYDFRCEPDKDNPWEFNGLDIVKARGCVINWNKGKNVTEKTVLKKQKHKQKNQVRTVTKTVKNDSFFNFFDPIELPDKEEIDEETEELMDADFEIGEVIRASIIPRAILFFTGDALDEDYEEEDDEDEEGEESDESELSEEEDLPPKRGGGGQKHGKHGGGKGTNKGQGQGLGKDPPPECKQQ